MRLLALICCVSPAFADTCPPAPDISEALTTLVAEAHAATDDAEGQRVSGEMWKLWLDAPDAAAQEVLDRGMQQRASYDFTGALASFAALIDYCPNYAEGYNQRAFVYFLNGEFSSALIDLDKALSLSPRHVGAQSGRALTLMNLGQTTEARTQMLDALENNPWLSERFLLSEGGPLGPEGQEL